MLRSTRGTRASLVRRVGKLEERLPRPEPEEFRPVHPEWVALPVALAAATKSGVTYDAAERRFLTVNYVTRQESFLAFWGEPHIDWPGVQRPPFMERELAERAGTLAVEYVEEVATTAHKGAHGRDTGETDGGLAFDRCCRLDGQTALREALTEAMVGQLSDPKLPHTDERVRELATIFVALRGQSLSLDGVRLPSNPRASRSDV
jgi:hypothetical protein